MAILIDLQGMEPDLPVIERTFVDPELNQEVTLRANHSYELDGMEDDYFDPPNYDPETGRYLDDDDEDEEEDGDNHS